MSIYVYGTKYGAGQIFAGLGDKDSGEGSCNGSHISGGMKGKSPYMKTGATPRKRITIAAIGLKAIEALPSTRRPSAGLPGLFVVTRSCLK